MTPATSLTGYINSILMTIFVIGVVIVLFEVARRVWLTLHGAPILQQAFGPPATAAGMPVSGGCC